MTLLFAATHLEPFGHSLMIMADLGFMFSVGLWETAKLQTSWTFGPLHSLPVLLFSLTHRQLVFSQTHDNWQQTPLSVCLVSTWCPQASALTLECVFDPKQQVKQRSLSDNTDIHNERFDSGLKVRDVGLWLSGQRFKSSEQPGKERVWDTSDPLKNHHQGRSHFTDFSWWVDTFISLSMSVVGLNNHQAQSNLNTTVWAQSSLKQFKWLRSEGVEFQKVHKVTIRLLLTTTAG